MKESEEDRHDSGDVPDVFKIFELFDYGTAIFDIDEDDDLDCLVTQRTHFDKDTPSATYVWIYGGGNGQDKTTVSFQVKPGPTVDTFLAIPDYDPDHEITGKFEYADYKNCAVMRMPFMNREECILWVTAEIKADVPQYCNEIYQDICGHTSPVYDESCN
ncbi:uncharacterized protein LOC144167404 isoform X2 [Haemaphysalis longicornis]